MELGEQDLLEIGVLLRYGLKPRQRTLSDEYSDLVTRFSDEPDFRRAVRLVAEGIGLDLLEATHYGVVVVPLANGPFAMQGEDYPNQTREDRLIDGLIYLAIMATIFPRPADLEEDPQKARAAITPSDVENSLRSICAGLEAKEKEQIVATEADEATTRSSTSYFDTSIQEEKAGLYPAWRAYQMRQAAAQNADGNNLRKTTLSAAKRCLDRLAQQGCFTVRKGRSEEIYEPTYLFNVLVQQGSAQQMHVAVHEALSLAAAG